MLLPLEFVILMRLYVIKTETGVVDSGILMTPSSAF